MYVCIYAMYYKLNNPLILTYTTTFCTLSVGYAILIDWIKKFWILLWHMRSGAEKSKMLFEITQ